MPRNHYSQGIRRQAAVLHALNGSYRRTAEQLGLSSSTIARWSRTTAWKEAQEEANQRMLERSLTQYRYIIDLSNRELVDRLERGEIRHTREGEEKRTPLKASTLVQINANAESRARSGAMGGDRITVNLSLAELSKEFQAIGQQYRRAVIEGHSEPTDSPEPTPQLQQREQ